MGALVRVNGGTKQWWLNGGIEKDEWGHWSGSMGVLKRVNGVAGHIEKGQVRRTGVWLSDRSLSYRVLSSTLQVCKLYLAGPQALPYTVARSTLQGCKLYLTGL